MRDNQNYKMYIKVQISLPGSIKRYWFINLDLLHLLVNCKTIRSIYSLKLFGREKSFKLLIIAHIKLLGKLALYCFYCRQYICQFTAANIWQYKNNHCQGDLNFFPQSFKNHSHFTNLKAITPVLCNITQVNKYQSTVTESTEY